MRYDAEGNWYPVGHPNHLKEMRCDCGAAIRNRTYTLDAALGFDGDLKTITKRDIELIPAQALAQERIRKFIDLPSRWVYLWGVPGNGKSTLAAWATNDLRAQGELVVFANVPRMMGYLRACVSGENTQYAEAMKYLGEVKVLVLDDLGAERKTEWVSEQLYLLLNTRYDCRKSTIVTSNVKPEELGDARLTSRLRDTTYSDVINCGAGDIRQVGKRR